MNWGRIKQRVKREDHYPAIAALHREWLQRFSEADDPHEREACIAGAKALQNWILYATVGKDRHDPHIVDLAREAAEHARSMTLKFFIPLRDDLSVEPLN